MNQLKINNSKLNSGYKVVRKTKAKVWLWSGFVHLFIAFHEHICMPAVVHVYDVCWDALRKSKGIGSCGTKDNGNSELPEENARIHIEGSKDSQPMGHLPSPFLPQHYTHLCNIVIKWRAFCFARNQYLPSLVPSFWTGSLQSRLTCISQYSCG